MYFPSTLITYNFKFAVSLLEEYEDLTFNFAFIIFIFLLLLDFFILVISFNEYSFEEYLFLFFKVVVIELSASDNSSKLLSSK